VTAPVPIILLLLAACGFANALYLTLIYYRVIDPASNAIPAFCRLGKQTCQAVVFTRYGQVFLIPNSVVALPFYGLLIWVALSRSVTGHYQFLPVVLAGSAASLVFSAYLVYVLLVRLKAHCALCLIGHTINLLIAALLVSIRMTG